MNSNKVIQVFEYETLRVETNGFTNSHFDLLAAYIDKRQDQYFQLGYRSIRFTNYVGVIQVQDLVIEVLPKTGRVSDKEVWREVLIDMLKISGFLNVTATSNALLKLRKGTLLDLYYQIFLNQCRQLLNEGLSRQYVQQTSNRKALKGRLIFNEQLKHNLIRKERFVTSAQDYTINNLLNQILRKALTILRNVSDNAGHRRDTTALLDQLDDISDRNFSRETFARITFNRATERYRTAIWIAELIILNYLPDVRGGNRAVLAIMFPMEELFEVYVARMLKNASRGTGFKIGTQKVQQFWRPERGRAKTIRPDIVIDWKDEIGSHRVVLDTKWKIPRDKRPGDADLKQMFAYNKYLKAESSNLVYPEVGSSTHHNGAFIGDDNGGCSMWYIPILDKDAKKLNLQIGATLHTLIRETYYQ
jgi:5-methylcytosine-specific restriction enzyme subunit McrC